MENRTEAFASSAMSSGTRPYQGGYRPTSVLEQIQPSTLGFGESERNRLLPGQVLPSRNGVSESTYQKLLWFQ